MTTMKAEEEKLKRWNGGGEGEICDNVKGKNTVAIVGCIIGQSPWGLCEGRGALQNDMQGQ
jgi:hypothetical protein